MRKAGIKQRQSSGDWEQLTNRQQRRITRLYDEWSASTRRALTDLARRGGTIAEQEALLERKLREFERKMQQVYDRGIEIAANASAGARKEQPRVQGLIAEKKAEGDRMISGNLVPLMLGSLVGAIAAGDAMNPKTLMADFNAVRSMPPQYSGGAWVMIFEVQRELGKQREHERKLEGLVAEKIRWVLDPRAEHCADSPGYHGCPDLAGEYNGWDSLPTVPAAQVTCRGNCILPGNNIDVTEVQALIRAWYSGPAVKFVTESGIEFTVTANHPILTPQGWLRAKLLNESDYVVKSAFGEVPVMPIDDDHEDMPTLIEEIWRTLSVTSGINACPGTPIMPDDFHGDGRAMNGDVDIILPYGILRGEFNDTLVDKPCENGPLHWGLLANRSLTAQSAGMKISNSPLAAPDRIMIGANLHGPLLRCHAHPSDLFGIALAAQGNSLSFESMGQGASAYTSILRQLQQAFARQVTLDKLVEVINFDYSGHVYDAQTDTGYYLLNSNIAQKAGIINSNCRCHLEVFRDGQWQRGVYE